MKFDSPSMRFLITDAIGCAFLCKKSERRERLIWLLLAWLLFTSPVPAQSQMEVQKRVLVLYSIREGAPVSDITERALQNRLIEGLAGNADYYREYIDVARFPDPQYQSALYDFLRRKYEHQTFDLIMTVAGRALDFVEQHGAQLFPGAPVVFLGGGSSKIEELRSRLNCTGVFESVNLRATLDLALKLQPGTSQVFVVSGASEFDRAYEKEFRDQARGLEGRLTFNYLCDLPLEEMQKRVAGLSEGSIVYYLMVTQDSTGNKFIPQDSLRKVTSAANAPVYIWFGGHMEQGVIGGSVMDIETLASQAIEMASRILRGEKPKNIPIIYADSTVNILNWRQLRRWGISDDNLPARRIIRFRDPTLWEEYQRYIFGAIALIISQMALITGLILARREQQIVKRELDDRLRFETMLSDLSADFLGLLPAEVDRKIQDWLQRLVEFLGVDRGAFLQFSDDGEIIHNTYRWVTPESDITAGFMTKIDSRERAPWYVGQLRRGVVLKSSRWLENLPPNAVDERENGHRIGIKSHLAIPISFGGSVICALAFSTVRSYRKWPPDLIARLNLVGEIFAGALSRKYADIEMQGLTARLLRSQDDERRRIAMELHDVTAQNLGTITINLAGLLQNRFRPSDVLRILMECRALSEQSLDELRTLSYLLHPPMLDQAGLVFALEWYIDGFIKRSGIRVVLVVSPDLNRLPPDVEIALFRVVQECLINIHRHSGSSTAEIRLERRDVRVILEVEDQGRGLPANGKVGEADDIVSVGVGIPGMRQRLSQLGGSLVIETGDQGTIVTAVLPLEEGGKYDSYSVGGRP
jgi:signal transduction histidine kinase/ABC-type uncharacterized transport system substrate-binding protein